MARAVRSGASNKKSTIKATIPKNASAKIEKKSKSTLPKKKTVVEKKKTMNSVPDLPPDDDLGRRSSDRKKIAVDRYGLDIIFVPKEKPYFAALSKLAESRPPPPAKSSLNATSSRSLNDSAATSAPSTSKTGTIRKIKSTAVSKSSAKKPAKSAKQEKDEVPKKKPRPTKRKPQEESNDGPSSSYARSDHDEADLEIGNDDASITDAPTTSKPKKRKRDSSAISPLTKRIKETIEIVATMANAGAESESDEGKGKTKAKTSAAADAKKAKDIDRRLKPRPQLKQFFHDPTFESKDELPFVSVPAYSKLAIRAVLINNESLLKRLVDDVQHVHDLRYERSVDVPYDAATYALLNGNAKLLQIITDDEKKPKSGRIQPVRSLLGQQTTGEYNFQMLGHAVRQIQMSRGGKEGVNALTKDIGLAAIEQCWVTRLKTALQRNVPFRLIQQLLLQNVLHPTSVAQLTYEAVRYGHNKLAGSMVKEYGGNWFNELHRQVLLNDNEQLKQFKAVSVKKKGNFNNDITPFHCACINPNEKYLAALMAVEFDYNHPDKNGYRPIHYAAACTSTGPLRTLLQKGAQPTELTKEGENSLHRACITGRAHNAELILQHCKSNDPELNIAKQKSRFGFTPIHLAAKNGHLDVVKAIVKVGGNALDIDQPSGPRSNAITALMLAAQQGHLPVVEYLVKETNASPLKLDKLKRPALSHAIINGMTHVASFLLRLGVDPDSADSSGNTPAHYAAAYGWYFCMKLLIDAGAKLNAANDWQLTPLAVAYMKGHMALADLLLQQAGIDINCRDDQGMTLVASTLLGTVDESTVDQLNYLIKAKGADPKSTDTSGNTPLHLLAAARLEAKPAKNLSEDEAKSKLSIKIAELLIERGVDVNAVNDTGATAMTIAVETGKLLLAHHLAEIGANLPHWDSTRVNKSNLLHQLINRLLPPKGNTDGENRESSSAALALEIFNILMKNQPDDALQLVVCPDNNGLTPFLLAVSKYGDQQEKTRSKLRSFISALLEVRPEVIVQRSGKIKVEGVVEADDEKGDTENEDGSNAEEKENESDQTGEDEEKSETANAKRKNRKIALEDGRSALHLLASARQSEIKDNPKTTDPLMQLLATHIKNHKEIDCTKERLFDAVDGSGETALFTAVKNRHSAMAIQLMEIGCNVNAFRRLPPTPKPVEEDQKGKEKPPKDTTADNVTILMEAVRVQLTTVFESLLKFGANVHALDNDENTALHYACTTSPSSTDIVKALLEAGANFEAKNKKSRTPLHLACNADTGATDVSTETLATLLNYGADPFSKDSCGRLPLHYAFVKIGEFENTTAIDPVALTTVLLPRMAGQPQSLNTADLIGCTPLHYAARRGSNICCMTLLRHSQAKRNAKDKNGNTPLALAVLHNHMACALALLQAEADVNVTVKEAEELQNDKYMKWAPINRARMEKLTSTLSSAVVSREWQGVVYLLIDIFTKTKQPVHPLLEAAVEHRKYNLALTLLRMFKTQPGMASQKPTGQKNLFHLLADNDRPQDEAGVKLQLSVAEALLDASVAMDIHKDDSSGPFHPAFYAARKRNVPLLRFFLEKAKSRQLNQYVISSSGHTILTAFLWNVLSGEIPNDDVQLLEDLKTKYGFSLDVLCRYSVPVDYTATDTSVCSYWTTRKEEEALITPLIHAIHGRSFDSIKMLLKIGANVNFADADGVTPLMHAIRLHEPNIIKLLLDFEYQRSNKEFEHRAEVYQKPGDAVNEEDMEDADNDQESDDDNESDSDQPTSRKRLAIGKGKAVRVFNTHGTLAIPKSQFSGTDPATTMAEMEKHDQLNSTNAAKKTSPVDLNMVDGQNRNALHHLAAPLPVGGWSNVKEIVRLLIDFGVDPNKKDRNGMTPLDYAKKFGQFQLAELLGATPADIPKAVSSDLYSGISDDGKDALSKAKAKVNVDQDASEYLAKVRQQKAEELQRKSASWQDQWKARLHRPHRLSGYTDIGEIVVDTAEIDGQVESQFYDVLLSKVDFHYGLNGYYNFYRMQLIQRKGSELYVVFTNWGRIGDAGQFQKTPFGKSADAVKEFRSIFKSKTGNEWVPGITKKFVEQPKKYRLINKEENEKLVESASVLDVPIVLDTHLKSALPQHLQRFMADVADVQELTETAKRVFLRSKFELTTTALKRDAVLKADSILNEIGDKLTELEKLRNDAHDKDKLEAGLKIYNELGALSTEFYFLLPMRGFEYSQVPIIADLHTWTESKSAVELLLKYEMANHLLCAAANRRSEVHPYDYIYSATGCKLRSLNTEDQESQMILHYIHNTADEGHSVMNIYKLWNEEQNERYLKTAEKIGNRWFMWHGTKAANIVSILRAGLMVAPPQALHTGHLFGKGIYVADAFSKSVGYCPVSHTGRRYAFLCEVALGKIARMHNITNIMETVDPLPEGYNSVQGVGRQVPHPQNDFVLRNGIQIPLGRQVDQVACVGKRTLPSYWLDDNEFIVYNPDQISLRYLVVFK